MTTRVPDAVPASHSAASTGPALDTTTKALDSKIASFGNNGGASPSHDEVYDRTAVNLWKNLNSHPCDSSNMLAFGPTPEFENDGTPERGTVGDTKTATDTKAATDARTAAGSVRPVSELGAAFDKVLGDNHGKQPPYDFSSVSADLKASALDAFRNGGEQGLKLFSDQLNTAIKAKRIGVQYIHNGDQIDMHMAQQIPKEDKEKYAGATDKELATEGLTRIPGAGVCWELAKPEKIDIPKTPADKLKEAAGPIVSAIEKSGGKDWADNTAKAFQDALNKGMPLDQLVAAVNSGMPASPFRGNRSAVSLMPMQDGSSLIEVAPGAGGFTLNASGKSGKWTVEDSGDVLRGPKKP
jgi:hypothetical protein